MRLEIEVPKEFESDYTGDKFKDFFSRVLCDIENGVLCGKYEKETVEMLIKAFDESKIAYDTEKVVADILKAESVYGRIPVSEAIEIVRNSGKEQANGRNR